jgi:hypothetical protein
VVGVADEEHAGFEVFEDVVVVGGVFAVGEVHAFDEAFAVGFGLEAADAPEAGVGEGAVVEVHGVLGGDDDADAEGAGLFHEGDEGAFGG